MPEPRQNDLAKALEIQKLQRHAALEAVSEASEIESEARRKQRELAEDRDNLIDYWTRLVTLAALDPGLIAHSAHALAVQEQAVLEASKNVDAAELRVEAERVHLALCDARRRVTFRLARRLQRRLRKRKDEKSLLLLELKIGARQ